MARFDEVELQPVPFFTDASVAAEAAAQTSTAEAPRFRRLVALLTDLSLFVALALALAPLLPPENDAIAAAALSGFVLLASFYYYVGTWLLWGKTIGGTIFDVRVVAAYDDGAMTFKAATLRWLATVFSVLIGGVGFLPAMFPARRSLPDIASGTRCITAS